MSELYACLRPAVPGKRDTARPTHVVIARDFFIDNLLVRIHFVSFSSTLLKASESGPLGAVHLPSHKWATLNPPGQTLPLFNLHILRYAR